jgi:SAM-dependent methyltransferase
VLTPHAARRWIKSRFWFEPLTRRLVGTNAYSESYYRDVERLEGESVPHVARWIADELAPSRVIDVGCGPGHLMRELSAHGIEVLGVDISDAAERATAAKGLPFRRFDLTDPEAELPGGPWDVAVSMEVAEHLEPRHAAGFVDKLTRAAPVVYLTAAEPDPTIGPGLFHFNEQPHGYWIGLFGERGFEHDRSATGEARRVLGGAGVISYLARPLVFRRRAD